MAAIPLDTGVTVGCTELALEQGLLIQTRPAFGGNIMARIITPNARPQIAAVRSGIFSGTRLDEAANSATRLVMADDFLPGNAKIIVKIAAESRAGITRYAAVPAIPAPGAGIRS